MGELWKVTCQEDVFPGMWQRWYKNQCVAVGWGPSEGYKLEGSKKGGKGWNTARNAIKEMQLGDYVIVALRGNRVGRLGMITDKAIKDDQWNPLVPIGPSYPNGDKGRRILVRWDLTVGPDNPDLVVQLPQDNKFNAYELLQTVTRIRTMSLEMLKDVMNDPANWVSLLRGFAYETALSDFIANYPGRLEAGLLPYPDSKIRERIFRDKKRLDVLLEDRQRRPVIVECKQSSPTIENLAQLKDYMNKFMEETGKIPRGILVHGGASKLPPEIIDEARKHPSVEIVSYRLEVNFTPLLITTGGRMLQPGSPGAPM
jgi:hypothetical protein